MNNTGKNKIIRWLIVFFFTLIFCSPSLIKIYNLRYLYFSKLIQSQSISLITDLREQKGWSATDLDLFGITGDGSVKQFGFYYHYNHPAVISAKQMIITGLPVKK